MCSTCYHQDNVSLLHVVYQTDSFIAGAQQYILTACTPPYGDTVDQTMVSRVLSYQRSTARVPSLQAAIR